jgi:autotransporter-associated beta strand protein
MQQNFITDNDASGAGLMKFTNNATAGSSTVFANNSGAFLEFHDASSADHGVFINSELGHTRFFDSSTADHGTFVNNGAPPDFLFAPGITDFFGTSTAANAIITNNGATSIGASGGLTNFFDSSTTDNATLIANGGSNVGSGAAIYFYQDSIGGTARVEVFGNGTGDFTNGALDISFHSAPGVTTGSIEGSGVVFLGANKLTVGSNNLTTTFSGVIQDGGLNGGTGGSLTKIGKGKVTLSNASTYTGGTTITKGTLLVTNRTGSGTGTAAVQVNTGTLGGTGKITGAVTVGTGTSSGPIVLPGKSATKPGTLTINSALTFNSRSTYKCVLDRSTLIAGKVSALGVTINSGASFTFVDIGTGTLTVGTVFTVINNTSASPIAGTFSNLANGAVFTSNGNNFQASYTGGTGNDLTLTVVP